MESQPQNPEFRNNPENSHPCDHYLEAQTSVRGLIWIYILSLTKVSALNDIRDKKNSQSKYYGKSSKILEDLSCIVLK